MKTIRAKILCIAVITVVLFCSVIVWLAYNFNQKYQALVTANCKVLIEGEFDYIETLLSHIEEQAKDIAQSGGVYYRLCRRSVEIDKSEILGNLVCRHSFLGGGIWFEPYAVYPDREKFCIYAFEKEGQIIYDEAFEGDEYNYPQQQWYISISKQLKDGKEAAWCDPYVDEAGTFSPMMTVGAGIYDHEGNLVGISTADLNIHFMLELSPELMFTPGTFISSVYEGTGETLSQTGQLKQEETLDFTRLFVNNVRLSVSIPKSELFDEIIDIMRNTTIIVIVIVVTLFIVIYALLDNFLHRPISALAEKTRAIGRGNLDTVIEIRNSDEIGELGMVINKMTSDIKQYIENLNHITRENERIRSELEIAATIQQEMLPALSTKDERYTIYAEMLPCREVGGDFYDAFLIDDEHLCLVIADVSGKGMPAALFMANAKTTIKTYAQMDISPSEIFTRANRQLNDGNETKMFVTAFLGILNLSTGGFTYVNAGHNPPLLMRSKQEFDYLRVHPNAILAVLEDLEYTESTLCFDKGDRLLLYTDGITETFNAEGEMFGEARLKKTVNEYKDAGLSEISVGLKKELSVFAGTVPIPDDITMLFVEYTKK